MQLCLLLCSSGSRRWCSRKRWRTWGKTTSTHPTLCCSSLPTTDNMIRRSRVMRCLWQTASDKASKSNYCLQYSQSNGSYAQSVSAHLRCALNRIIFSRWHHCDSETSSILILFFFCISASVVNPASQNIQSFPRLKASAELFKVNRHMYRAIQWEN